MPLVRRGKRWWADFYDANGERQRVSTRTSNKNIAKQVYKQLVESAEEGTLHIQRRAPKRLFAAVDAYLADKVIRCAQRTVELEKERLSVVKKHFGDAALASIRPDTIGQYQHKRKEAHIANRTINMDVSALLRVLDFCGRLKPLKESLKRLHPLIEEPTLVGRALTVEEQDRLLKVAQSNPEWEHVYCAAVVAALTTMHSVEVRRLRRQDVDLFKQEVHVPYGKNKHRLRSIPLLPEAVNALARMLARLDALGFTEPHHYLWCACKWNRFDATKPQSRWDAAWHSLRAKAGLPGLRFHDLRHTLVTELNETLAPDMVIQSIAGHTSKRMQERYSHIRMNAKRKALEGVDAAREERRRQSQQKTQSETETVQ